MTSLREVKSWTRSFLIRHPELWTSGRLMVLPPVRHFIRVIYIDRSSRQNVARIFCSVEPLFERQAGFGYFWNHDPYIPPSDSPGFQQAFDQALEDCLKHGLERINSLEDFVTETSLVSARFFGPLPLPRYNGRYGRVLAALGRLDEAEPLLAQDLADDVVTRRAANPNLPARLFDVEPDSVERHAYHVGLLAAVRSRDHHAVAALLRDCERLQAERWKIGHLWEPTPFTVEAM